MKEKKATIHDVARMAEVSYQTVSRVINASPNVADDTRSRVLQAIQTLKFQPNRVARALTTGRSRTLQFINYSPAHPIMGEILYKARETDYRVVFSSPAFDDLRREITELVSNQIDGFLLLAPHLELTYNELRELAQGIPFVALDANIGPDAPCVLLDQHYGMRLLVEHLVALGHRHFAEIIGPGQFYDSNARHEAYVETLGRYGIDTGPSAVSTHFTAATGYHAAREILATGQHFTALMCANDQSAFGAMRALREHGLRVPEDVSVTGFDNDPVSAYYAPGLTTIQQDYGELARQSLEHLIQLIDHPETPPYRRVLTPRLIIRQSTTAPKG
jgi:LacI family transcriptional regulator